MKTKLWTPQNKREMFIGFLPPLKTILQLNITQIWNPLTVEYPNEIMVLKLRIETISTDPKLQKSMDLPNPIGSEKSVSLAHLELGEYQLFIKPPQTNEEIKGTLFC